MISLHQLRVAVVTHFFATGPAQALAEYLRSRTVCLAFIEHPFSYASRTRSSCLFYKNGTLARRWMSVEVWGPDVLYFLKDLLYTLLFCVWTGVRFDVFVGCGNLNALGGLALRALGRTRSVVFYTIDYVPIRFSNPWLNRLYRALDRWCCRHADVVWNVSPRIAEAREKAGYPKVEVAPQIAVPLGNNFESVPRRPLEDIDRHCIAYMGHVRENQGIDLLIRVFPEVLIRVPEARLLIIGDGPLLLPYRDLVNTLGLTERVRFTGYVPDHSEVERLLCGCAVGVAAYSPCPENFTFFADPGKPKVYLAAGLPVVITRVPQVAQEIHNQCAGLAIEYDADQLAEALHRLLTDDVLYRDLRDNAVRFAATFQWDKIFDLAFEKSGLFMSRKKR